MVNDDETPQSLLTFPCEFVIKTFGLSSPEFETAVISIVRKHVSHLREDAFRSRLSKDDKYLALTVTITAESREQLDNLYRELSGDPLVLMVL